MSFGRKKPTLPDVMNGQWNADYGGMCAKDTLKNCPDSALDGQQVLMPLVSKKKLGGRITEQIEASFLFVTRLLRYFTI